MALWLDEKLEKHTAVIALSLVQYESHLEECVKLCSGGAGVALQQESKHSWE